ncbi:helix-turn-helix transcriptional regulator [Amycolatopsis sp. H20-H5]|uniref:helix-turn-helix transcriptional regulator n=1 Tax=Amycolatopsis sp. H20-H5 TaxID=3046309 RepID=UPI002DB71CCA|nr:helix-turn-helix transcriptional regulator [Amycolatopsis sp. H20-H5]MEC3979285.1 helix-turn-helix transcriptional regulator [Amycolatopsis sp. H20-H5]
MSLLALDPAAGLPGWSGAGPEALLASATRDVLILTGRTTAGLDPIGTLRPIDHENLRRGVRYRVLATDRARTAPGLSSQLAGLAMAGAAVRTVARIPGDALVIDGTVAVLPVSRTATGAVSGVASFHLPAVVTTTVELFDWVWAAGVPMVAAGVPENETAAARQRKLLTLLAEGCTDAMVADRLGISVRTVRRTVSELMNRLGAASRFQAGAKAAARGWLAEKAS